MTIKHLWSIICKESLVNQDDNLISLIGVLENINSVMKPKDDSYKKQEKLIIPINFELVTYLVKEDDKETKVDIKVEMIDPQSKKISEVVNKIIFPQNTKRIRARLKISGLPVTINGTYLFRINIKDEKESSYKKVSELPLEVNYKIEEQTSKPQN